MKIIILAFLYLLLFTPVLSLSVLSQSADDLKKLEAMINMPGLNEAHKQKLKEAHSNLKALLNKENKEGHTTDRKDGSSRSWEQQFRREWKVVPNTLENKWQKGLTKFKDSRDLVDLAIEKEKRKRNEWFKKKANEAHYYSKNLSDINNFKNVDTSYIQILNEALIFHLDLKLAKYLTITAKTKEERRSANLALNITERSAKTKELSVEQLSLMAEKVEEYLKSQRDSKSLSALRLSLIRLRRKYLNEFLFYCRSVGLPDEPPATGRKGKKGNRYKRNRKKQFLLEGELRSIIEIGKHFSEIYLKDGAHYKDEVDSRLEDEYMVFKRLHSLSLSANEKKLLGAKKSLIQQQIYQYKRGRTELNREWSQPKNYSNQFNKQEIILRSKMKKWIKIFTQTNGDVIFKKKELEYRVWHWISNFSMILK